MFGFGLSKHVHVDLMTSVASFKSNFNTMEIIWEIMVPKYSKGSIKLDAFIKLLVY